MLSKFDRKRYELIKYLTPSSPIKTTIMKAIPVIVGPASTSVAAAQSGNPVTPSPSSTTSNNSETNRSRSRKDEEIEGGSYALGGCTETYSLPSPPHSYPSSLTHDESMMKQENEACGPPHAVFEDQVNFEDVVDHEQQEDEYDGDILFSDLAGYFARMKQAANGNFFF